MTWQFIEMRPNDMDMDVTEFDQFYTDEQSLSESIVREAVQNSLDAIEQGKNTPVQVSFSIKHITVPSQVKQAKDYFIDLKEHLACSGIDCGDFEAPMNFSALIIEDFGTKGLTGEYTQKADKGNFSDFWWRHGVSNKSGKNNGRWGLGKISYAASSSIRSFLGLTVRSDDDKSLLMGQAILKTHAYQGSQYRPHVHYAKKVENHDWYQPYYDEKTTSDFKETFALERANTPGLSLVIPYPREDVIREGDMLEAAIKNYFFPIITGKLEIEIGDIILSEKTIKKIAEKSNSLGKDTKELFTFADEIKKHQADHSTSSIKLPSTWIDHKNFESIFTDEELASIQSKYSEGKLIGFRVPISFARKRKSSFGGNSKRYVNSEFEIYIKKPNDLIKGRNLYIRNGLIITKEGRTKYNEESFGALIAQTGDVAEFLGDAENPSHTKWTGTASKLTEKYYSPSIILSNIRRSLIQLQLLLSKQVETVNEEALIDFFYTLEPEQSSSTKKKKKKKKSPEKPENLPSPKPKPAAIQQSKNGFSINSTEHLNEEDLPLHLKIVAAYDTLSGNPFKSYETFDFNFSDNSQFSFQSNGVQISKSDHNIIEATATTTDFKFKIHGFDRNRDLKVKFSIRGAE